VKRRKRKKQRTKSGRELQIVGAAKEKERRQVADLTKGTDRRFLFAEEESAGDQRDMVAGGV